MTFPTRSPACRAWRDERHAGAPIDIGTMAEPIYLSAGAPSWDVPGYVHRGGADEIASSLRELVAMGVNHLQIRFAARSAAEFCEQTAAFGADVGPLLSA